MLPRIVWSLYLVWQKKNLKIALLSRPRTRQTYDIVRRRFLVVSWINHCGVHLSLMRKSDLHSTGDVVMHYCSLENPLPLWWWFSAARCCISRPPWQPRRARHALGVSHLPECDRLLWIKGITASLLSDSRIARRSPTRRRSRQAAQCFSFSAALSCTHTCRSTPEPKYVLNWWVSAANLI